MIKDPWFKPKREPDEIIGGTERPYLQRWYVARKSRIPFLSKLLENVYIHRILRSDDDRALHDHPWWNVSIVLSGGYYEHRFDYPNMWIWFPSIHRVWRGVGSVVFRCAKQAHRLELPEHPPRQTWTLFITGRKSREWGFYCPGGWRHWKIFGDRGCS